MPPALVLDNLTVAYDRHSAVHHLSGRFEPGSLTALVGPNGAGKSTLLKALTGELRAAEGRIDLGGLKPGDLAYLPQHSALDRTFPIDVLEMVLLGLWGRVGPFGRVTMAMREEGRRALSAVKLAGFERRSIASLSVGQLQRALFARVLLQDAPIILLDEPFNAIDARTTADLVQQIYRWHGERRTVVAALHDLGQVREHFPQTLLLARRCVDWGPTARVLTAENQFRARGMAENWAASAAICRSAVA
ncbi:MAG: ABC transporter ATP-binding protein [Alphaproteobacteria bacterium]|nr:ABC transporter ATP-binding protein [Alphaproteobacteria bacterium]